MMPLLVSPTAKQGIRHQPIGSMMQVSWNRSSSWESWKRLVSVWVYHSFSGEVEASNTPTMRRLIPSCRRQLLRIAPRWSAGSRMRQAMAHRDPSSPTPMPTILRYGIAVLSVAIAIGLDFFLLRHFDAKLTPFLFAVAATAWYAR